MQEDLKFNEYERQYRKMIYSIINKLNVNNNICVLSIDDMYQEGLIALYDAFKTYDCNKYEIAFSTYSYTIIRRRLLRVVEKHNKKASFETIAYDAMENIDYYAEFSYEDKVIYNSGEVKLSEYIKKLPKLERQIAELYIKKNSYKAIAEKLNIKVKQVDNKITKIKKILRKIFEDNYI